MRDLFLDPKGDISWTAVGVSVFAVIFLIVGLTRVVEVAALQIGSKTRIALMAVHVVGCFLFALALVLLGVDEHGLYHTILIACFSAGLALLFPLHIYVGLKRRISQRRQQGLN